MKLFLAPSINKNRVLSALPLIAAVIASGYALGAVSCVSAPKPSASAAATTAPESPAAPQVLAKDAIKPIERPGLSTIAPLVEPAVPLDASKRMPPTDITVLSAAPIVTIATGALPEPAVAAPVPAPPATPSVAVPAAIAEKPVATAKPAAPIAPAKPVSAAPVAKPAVKPAAATPAPATAAAATPAPATTATTTPAPVTVPPPIELPPSPSSSARAVVPGPSPVAETRIETAKGERFELRFPGNGWIYLGDEEGREGLKYETRRYEDNAAVFAMDPERSGEYLLRFQRQNPVDQATEVSLVRVIVMDKAAPSVTAGARPAESAALPASATGASAALPGATPGSSAASASGVPAVTAAATTPTVAVAQLPAAASAALASITDPAALIAFARDELEAKRVQSAIAALDRYLSLYPYGTDELFFLYGLAYEQDTPFRNIKKSYDSYKRLHDEYPRSPRWREVAERIAYLEKHYFGLR